MELIGKIFILIFCIAPGLRGNARKAAWQLKGMKWNDANKLKKMERKDWISFIDGNQQLNEISIPGTHDTMADYRFTGRSPHLVAAKFFTPIIPFVKRLEDYVQAQVLTLMDQLNFGIRYLDIRLRNTGQGLSLYHGPFYLHYEFENVMDTVTYFLSQNPSETIIMSYQEETAGDWQDMGRTKDPFKDVFGNILRRQKYSNYIYGLDNGGLYQTFPKLDDVRGQIVFFDKEGNGNFGYNKKGKTKVLDNFEYVDVTSTSTTYYDEIMGNIRGSVAASKVRGNSKLWITFLTANNVKEVGKTPGEIASYVNPNIETQLKRISNKEGFFGVVVMDYPPHSLINTIIGRNKLIGRQAVKAKNCASVGATLDYENQITLPQGDFETKNGWPSQYWFKYVKVEPDCILTLYSERNFKKGYEKRIAFPFRGSGTSYYDYKGWLGWWWQNDVLSYKCSCSLPPWIVSMGV